MSTTHGRGFTLFITFDVERQVGKGFGLTRPGIEPESTVSVADGLSTRH